jgi:hypothetical protein
MKKIRVYTITGIALGIQGFGLLIHLILYNFFHIELLQLQIMGFSLILLGLSQFFGLTTSDDFKKNNNGYIIDDKETINWYLNHSFFLFCFVFQLIFAIDPMMGTRMIGGNFNYVLTSLLPTFIFILRSFVKKNTINERELIKLNRRDRIKTSDLNELSEKVDLKKWFFDDLVLQKDKELIIKLISIAVLFPSEVDDNLLEDNKFILDIVRCNEYAIIYLSEENKNNIEVVLEYLKTYPENAALIEVINKSLLDHPSISPFIINQTEEVKKIALIKFLAIMKMKEMLGK